ncbi:MAG: helix-turn-helix domain-containing protein [Bdellovibrionales bacterium]
MRNVKVHGAKKQGDYDAFARIGDFFREKRIDAGLTQADVANALGLSTGQFISNWERGVSAPPMDYLPKLVKLYKMNKSQLVALYTAEQERYIKAVLSR